MVLKRVAGCLLLLCLSASLQAAQVTVAVAANFTGAMRELVSVFEAETGHRVRVSYGSTGKLYAQIENGAPYELFLAADAARPQRLEQQGLAQANMRFTYAQGQLVLWSPQPGLFTDGEQFLKQGAFRRLAIANPKTAPYGAAAQEALENLGLWDTLASRIVRGDSIAQTFQFTATGNAQAGMIAEAQVLQLADRGSLWRVPPSLHAPIVQQAVLLNKGRDNPAALEFWQFLQSEKAGTIIRRQGYGRAP